MGHFIEAYRIYLCDDSNEVRATELETGTTMKIPQSEITQILQIIEAGDPDARAKLIEAAYDDLRNLASRRMARERQDHTLTATALVHEVSIKLLGEGAVPEKTEQFFAYAARAMRHLLIDHARTKGRLIRGGDRNRVPLEDNNANDSPSEHESLLELNEALDELANVDQRKAQIVELKYFGRMTNQEIADALGISITTVKREWEVARGWLFRELGDE